MHPLETLNCLNLLDLSGNSPQICECYQPVCIKNLRIFCFQKCYDRIIFFHMPGSGSHTVKRF